MADGGHAAERKREMLEMFADRRERQFTLEAGKRRIECNSSASFTGITKRKRPAFLPPAVMSRSR